MKRLLIVKLSSFGDVLHALPVVQSIKADLPELFIGWAVRDRCAGLVTDAEFIDIVHILPSKPNLFDFNMLRKELRAERYDTAFDMQGLFSSGLVAAASGAPRRVGLNRNREFNKLFLTEPSVEGRKPGEHAVDVLRGFRSASGLGLASESSKAEHLGSKSQEWWNRFDFSDHSRRLVVLNVGASTIYKRWPREHWTDLGESLLRLGCKIILTAGVTEQEDSTVIERQLDDPTNVINLGGKTTADQLATVLRNADLVISGDTGPMHLAAAVTTPTIALFGPTDPRLTGPYGSEHRVIWKKLSCSPCFRHPTCDGRVDCLKAISAEEVAAMAADMLPLNLLTGVTS
jgi:heptosyltransferase I